MSRRAGYSLLEVLVAFAIMSLVLAALLPGQASLLARTKTSQDKVLALDYALSVLDSAGLQTPLRDGTERWTHLGWTVSRQTMRLAPNDGDPRTYRLSVKILSADDTPLAEAETYRAQRP